MHCFLPLPPDPNRVTCILYINTVMRNYIEQAHATSAPVDDCQQRLINDRLSNQRLRCLMILGSTLIDLSHALNDFKKSAFGGKDMHLTGADVMLPEEAKANALKALQDPGLVELLHAATGIATEAGELFEVLLGTIFEGKRLDIVNVREESGDLLWYMAKLLKFSGTSFEAEMERNLAKLAKRHGAKFKAEAADEEGRDRAAERKILEGEPGYLQGDGQINRDGSFTPTVEVEGGPA